LQVKCLRSDGGGEYFSNEFTTYLKMHGIQRQFTCRYTPQQNGVAERKNKHIAEVARALMANKSMPHHYWAEAVATTVYIMNRCPNPSLGLATKARGLQGCEPKKSPGVKAKALQGCGPRRSRGVISHTPENVRSVRECEGVNTHTPKATPTLGDGVPVDS
jgi:transposase InsO family protein